MKKNRRVEVLMETNNHRRNNIASVLFLIITPLSLLLGGELRYTLWLSPTGVDYKDSGGFTQISFEGSRCYAEPGHPWVPFMVKQYLLPQGTHFESARLEVLSYRTVKLEKPVYPAQPFRPVSSTAAEEFIGPLQQIYSSSEPVTNFEADLINEGLLEGQRIINVAVHPIRYTPAAGELDIAERMLLVIEYENAPSYSFDIPLTSSQKSNLVRRLNSAVDNPQSTPITGNNLAEVKYRHAILTTSAFKSAFQPLAEWNTKRGVRDTILTLENMASYSGKDLAERIRNFVKFAHSNWGLEYLLIGGDPTLVPTRDCYTTAIDGNHYDTIPTDMYFGCLDGNWDASNNGVYGELGDNADLYAEVAVGRISVEDVSQVADFVSKLISYETNPPSGYSYKLMLPSEILWVDPYYPGDETNNAIASLAPSGTQQEKLYETSGTLSCDIVRDSLTAGVGLAHHMGHGNIWIIATGPDAFTSVMARELKNADRVAVYNSIACLVGAFDFKSCLVEEFQSAPAGGTVAWIGNSRYGWGMPPMRGPSEDLDISFFQSIYGQGNPDVGSALVDAKDANASDWGGSDIGLWCIYELNLHGDPAMPVHYREISNFAVSYPEPVTEGLQEFVVKVTSGAGYPVDGILVCARQGSNMYSWAKTDVSGNARLTINPAVGTMSLSVSGANHEFWNKDGIQVGPRVPSIVLTPDTVWIDSKTQSLNSSFRIYNDGTDTLKISSIAPQNSSWINSLSVTQANVLPGAYLFVNFNVDTTGLDDDIYTGTIRITSNDPSSPSGEPVKLIKGDWPDIDMNPSELVFDIPAGDPLEAYSSISNHGRAELVVSEATTTTKWISAFEPKAFNLAVSDSTTLDVIIDTTGVGFGTFEGQITFSTNDPDENPKSYPVRLIMGEPDIKISPDTLEFFVSYETPTRNVTSVNMTVKNQGTRTLYVSNLVPSTQWIEVAEPREFELLPQASRVVQVTVNPQGLKQGVYNAYITVSSNDVDEASKREPVLLLVEESPPEIACAPDTVIVDKETMHGYFWVYNDGMRDLVVSNISSETPWIYGAWPKGFTVRGQDSAQVTVIGDPSKVASGPKIGIITIESNDTHDPSRKMPVKVGSASAVSEGIPKVFELSQVSPNPASGRCLVSYAAPRETEVLLAAYDVSGKRVKVFEKGRVAPGYYHYLWTGEDDLGRALPQGVYLIRMESPDYKATQRIILLR